MSHRIFTTPFAKIYPMYVQKVERKGRSRAELDAVITWLTGYDAAGLQAQLDRGADITAFFAEAPAIHPDSERIRGVVCGVRVEAVEDPLMRRVRQLEKVLSRPKIA